jgi:ribosomal protein S18 acetylase RimI-like enzyme
MKIDHVRDIAAVEAGADLFDDVPQRDAIVRFLGQAGHHLLFAYDDDNKPIGFVTGTELTHPDKGTEMYFNELGVAEEARRNGVATALVEALIATAKEAGCYGMWGVTEPDNLAALATYRRAQANSKEDVVLLAWDFSAKA